MAEPVCQTTVEMEEVTRVMSLLDSVKQTCQIYNKSTVADGYGGYTTVWTAGVTFDAALSMDQSIEGVVAQAQGVTAVYTVLTGREINLQYHDVFRRLEDGKVFRVTSDGDDSKTPNIAGLNLRSVRAEEWELTND